MKIVDGFVLRTIAGESVVVGEGLKQVDFNKLIALNSTAAFLWKEIEGKEFDEEMLSQLLIEQYRIDEATAQNDASEVIREWHKIGLIED